jgi:colanic acid biosynthesis protein WcaH
MAKRRLAPLELFRQTVRHFPMVSVNIVLQRPDGAFLFLRRKNNPVKGEWWVPGGRLLNGETIEHGILSVLEQETGLTGELVTVSPEYFEEIFNTKDFSGDDWTLYDRATAHVHYLATAGLVRVSDDHAPKLDDQSTDVLWSKTLPNDHPYLRRYFTALEKTIGRVLIS